MKYISPNDKIVDVATDIQDGSIKLAQLAAVFMFVGQKDIASQFLIAACLLGIQSIMVIKNFQLPSTPAVFGK